jgi:putative proteasome-type protease
MTYCVAALVEEGVVFASDSRTSAGLDNIAMFSKMHVFETPGERLIVVLSSGNLATAQSVLALIRMRGKDENKTPLPGGIYSVKRMYEAAKLVGSTLCEVMKETEGLTQSQVDMNCNFIVGGQIDGKHPRLFRVYPEGNFIEATKDTNYFQIGEHKYGKPIMDRVVHYGTPLRDTAKAIILSFDSTMRSNLTVGLPIDLLAYETDQARVTLRRRFGEGDPYFSKLSGIWSAGLRRAFGEVPDIDWVAPDKSG